MAQSNKNDLTSPDFHPAGNAQRTNNRQAQNSFPHNKINNVQTGEDYEMSKNVSDRDRIFYRSNIDDWQG